MRSALLTLLAVPAGLLAGYLGGRAAAPAGPPAPAGVSSTSPRAASLRSASSVSDGVAPHDLQHLTRLIKSLGGDDRIERQLERMESSALRELALGEAPDGEQGADQARSRHLLLNLIASELFRREGIAALEWADQLEGGVRAAMLKKMVTDAATADPVSAKPWVDKMLAEYGRVSNYAMAAESGAKARGAEDLAKVYELYSGVGMPYSSGGDGFARDFDFGKFVSLTFGKGFIDTAITSWAARDPEAALAAMIEHSKEQAEKSVRYTGSLFQGAAAVMGDEAAAQWITGKIDEFPAEVRDEAVKSLRGITRLSGSVVDAIMTALPSPHDRLIFASEVLSPHGSTQGNQALLAAFKSPDSGTELLLHLAPRYRLAIASKNPSSEKVLTFFEDTMEDLNLPEPNRRQVMDSLHQPPDRR